MQPRCCTTLGRWTFSPNCLLTWSPACELSLMEPWTSCSTYQNCSPVAQLSIHMDHVVHLQKVFNVRPIICLTLVSVIHKILNFHHMILEAVWLKWSILPNCFKLSCMEMLSQLQVSCLLFQLKRICLKWVISTRACQIIWIYRLTR